jgi:biopolymer transport protein ExbD
VSKPPNSIRGGKKMTTKPQINVTPLIDVLLVLLIIFMVISPLKPTDFKAQIPSEPKSDVKILDNVDTLVVSLLSDSTLKINNEKGYGDANNAENLINRLEGIFKERARNGVLAERLIGRTDLSYDQKIEKTVFIKAPRSMDYGSVAKVIDAVKISGASPISLQIDEVE